ncbi:hypothetical protein HDU96_008677 [Phlyctochytrium bullatum]|nr:hypothetical protein HDU96_008677 [Phlyctochytrium bullatum]
MAIPPPGASMDVNWFWKDVTPSKTAWVAYARKSLDEVDNSSVEHQIDMIKSWAEKQGHTVKVSFTDIASGAIQDRPGLLEALKSCINDGEVAGIAVYRVDRLSRDSLQILSVIDKLKGANRRFVSVSEYGINVMPTGKEDVGSVTNLLLKCMFAEVERLTTSKVSWFERL